jgi:membrane complex biogenesis BtpA family protein
VPRPKTARPGPVIGVVHLLPLPGSPGYGGSMERILARAVGDARAYAKGGAHAVLVENHGDVPFFKEALPAETVAALACAAAAVRAAVDLPLGVNALRNDARAALGVAAAAGASFVRVNVLAGAYATDQGIVEGRAAELLRVRRLLGADVGILADVHVKHATPLRGGAIGDAVRDLSFRAGADGVIVSGLSTGAPTSLADLRAVRAALPRAFLLAGSGATEATVREILAVADAVIVGTALERGGRTGAPVDAARVARFTRAAKGAARARGR